jgi:hypothetical protein
MTFEEFKASLTSAQPPKGLSELLNSLWYDGRGDWEISHHIAQDINNHDGARIHAYLHRKEGDLWNADYWYSRAGTTRPEISLEEEWELLVRAFL